MNKIGEGIFRKTAIEHYLQGEEGGGLLQVSPPWTWALFWILSALLLVVLIGMMTFPVEVNSRGRGVLQPLPGVRVLNAQLGGIVAQVLVHSGEPVKRGQPLLNLDSANLQSQLLEADRKLSLLQSDFKFYSFQLDNLYSQQESILKARQSMLEEQVKSQQQSIYLYIRKLKASEVLGKSGLVSAMNVDEAREAVAQAERQLSTNQQSLASAKQELAALGARRQEELWKREQDLRQAQSHRDALQFSLDQTQIKAPIDGVMESVLIKPGDAIQPGRILGKIIPQNTPFIVVAFVPEKDRAFLNVGENARLELDQYPYAEFGTLGARILRISNDLATVAELQEAFGDAAKPEGATYRVELELLTTRHSMKDKQRLGSGMLMQVRFALRKQRPITLILEPLRQWLD